MTIVLSSWNKRTGPVFDVAKHLLHVELLDKIIIKRISKHINILH